MGFWGLDLIKEVLETNIFGSPVLLGLAVVGIIIVLLLISRIRSEAALLIPMPLMIALAEAGMIPFYFKALIYIVAGFYLAIIIMTIVGINSRQ